MAYKIIVPIILAIMVMGCSTTPTKYVTRIETVTVYKPVYTPPENLKNLPKLVRPELATNKLSPEDVQNPGHVVKLTIESIAQLRTYAEQLEDQIEVYRGVLLKSSDPLPEPHTEISETVDYRNDK